MMKKLIKV